MQTQALLRPRLLSAAAGLLAWITAGTLAGMVSYAGDMYHLSPVAGGVPAQSQITSTTITPTNATLCWYGMQGWYSVQAATNLAGPWTAVGRGSASDYSWCMTVPNTNGPSALFRLNQNNAYVGSGGCAGCHGDKHLPWRITDHAWCYSNLASLPPAAQATNLVFYTVGFGQPTGFTDTTNTPHLENVGCENCHGPGGWHKYSDHEVIHPAVTVAAEVCGGCHNGAQHPVYNEWTNSAHSVIVDHVATYFLDPNPLTGRQRQMSCGPCHSAATRVALLDDCGQRLAGNTNYLTLPSAHDAATYPQTCVACHDPHQKYNNSQLRSPIFSTNFFTFFTSYEQANVYYTNFMGVITTNVYFLNTGFATQYNSSIQICGQCHNSRGAQWTDTSRPPHHSPQYNLLIGAVQAAYLNGATSMPATHGANTNGCGQCHMHSTTVASPTDANPNYTGHRFDVRLEGCALAGCHGSTNEARSLIGATQSGVTNTIANVVSVLNLWANLKAPPILKTNYGLLSWEYTTPGSLSDPYGTNAGPATAQQAYVPNTIKQARFNLYSVFHDQSLGVHNGTYARLLLNLANSNVIYELNH